MRAMSVSFPGPRAFSPTFDTQNRPGVTVLARGDDPPEPPAGLRPGSSVTGPGPCWPGGTTPRNPPLAYGPVPPSPGRGHAGPGGRPPGTPRWPTARFLRHRAGAMLARG